MDEPISTKEMLSAKDKPSRWAALQARLDSDIADWSDPEYLSSYSSFKNDLEHLISATDKYRQTRQVMAEVQRRLSTPGLNDKTRRNLLAGLEQCEADLYLFAYHGGYWAGSIHGSIREAPSCEE